MAVLVGIDEAGYGPLLGPLVVMGAAFRVGGDGPGGCLWERLGGSVTRKISKRDLRLPIVDSKKLFRRGEGLKALERSALVMLAAGDRPVGGSAELLGRLAPEAVAALDEYPWYGGFDRRLPVDCLEADVAVRANAVRRDMASSGVELLGVFGEALPAGHFNRMVSRTHNKAVVSLGMVLRILDRVVSAGGGEPVWAFVDRQGGRVRYRDCLMTAFGDRSLAIESESSASSVYTLTGGRGRLAVEFLTSGEERHMAVALASVFSKYLRELFMMAFNGFWCERVKGLVPTAGYYQDGKRFLSQISDAIDGVGVSRAMLVRDR